MNIKDITVGIVTFRSEKVIFKCLKSLENIKKMKDFMIDPILLIIVQSQSAIFA